MNYFADYIDYVADCLRKTQVTDRSGVDLGVEEGLDAWVWKTAEIRDEKQGLFFFIGNGASATMAEHMAADALKNAHLKTVTGSETAYLTAVANDISSEDLFAVKIDRMMSANDMLITISSSGNSPNVIKAVETAREKDGFVVTVSGLKAENKSRSLGDLNFYVPAESYGTVEAAHGVLLHCWIDRFLDKYLGGRL